MKLFGRKKDQDEREPRTAWQEDGGGQTAQSVDLETKLFEEQAALGEFLDVDDAPDAPNALEAEAGAEADADAEAEPVKEIRHALPEFTLSYETEGVFFTFEPKRKPQQIKQQNLIRHFLRKEIKGLDKAALQEAILSANAQRLPIAPAQHETVYDEAYTLHVENNHMQAYMTLLPPEEGRGLLLDADDVLDELERVHKLTYGLKAYAIRRALREKRYDERVLIAEGIPPVPGVDGRLEFFFNHERANDAATLRQAADNEKVDHKNLDIFERVEKDQLLVTKIPPTEGKPGKTVYGKPVSAPAGKTYNLPVGKNTYVSEDKLSMHAKESGRVDYINGYVEVSNCYLVNGDVNIGVGNIDFNGDVTITGNVISGYTIKATGNIEVHGIVEAAVLESDKDIVIRGGMQGSGKGMLIAGGGVFVRFVEYATVQASDVVVAESLLHSNINCFGPVEVLNGRGSILGGNVCAGTYIATRFLGNTGGRSTQIEVGVSPGHKAQLRATEETVVSLRDAVNKLQRIVQLPPLKNETPRQKMARIEAMKRLLVQKKVLDDNVTALARIREQIEQMRDGQVHVLMTAYPGVTISIAFERYTVQTPITYVTFRMEDSAIGFTSCRFKEQATRLKRMKKR